MFFSYSLNDSRFGLALFVSLSGCIENCDYCCNSSLQRYHRDKLSDISLFKKLDDEIVDALNNNIYNIVVGGGDILMKENRDITEEIIKTVNNSMNITVQLNINSLFRNFDFFESYYDYVDEIYLSLNYADNNMWDWIKENKNKYDKITTCLVYHKNIEPLDQEFELVDVLHIDINDSIYNEALYIAKEYNIEKINSKERGVEYVKKI